MTIPFSQDLLQRLTAAVPMGSTPPLSGGLTGQLPVGGTIPAPYTAAGWEEERKRRLREALALGLPIRDVTAGGTPTELPAITVEAPRPALPQLANVLARETRPELAGTTSAPTSPLEKYSVGGVLADIAAQPIAALQSTAGTLGEGVQRTLGFEEAARRTRERTAAMNEALAPSTGPGVAARLASSLVSEAAPFVAATPIMPAGGLATAAGRQAFLSGLGRSAALTGIQSRAEEGSTVKALADVTGFKPLQAIAASPYKTAADIAIDLGLNIAPEVIGGALRGTRTAARAAEPGFLPAAQAVTRQVGRNIAAAPATVGQLAQELPRAIRQDPGSFLSAAATLGGEAIAPGLGTLAATLPATMLAGEALSGVGKTFPERLFSRLERAIEAAPFEKGTPQQWQAALAKNVAAGEREWTGVDEFLRTSTAPTLSKADVMAHFQQRKIRLGEKVLDSQLERAKRDAVDNFRSELRDIDNQQIDLGDQLIAETPEFQQLDAAEQELGNVTRQSRNATENAKTQYRNDLTVAKSAISLVYDDFGYDTPEQAWRDLLSEVERSGDDASWEVMFDANTSAGYSAEELAQAKNAINKAIASYRALREASAPYEALIAAAQSRINGLSSVVHNLRSELEGRSAAYQALEARREDIKQQIASVEFPQYRDYVQPGESENYREILLTLDGQDATQAYKSSHWPETPNPLLHIRLTDRALPSGEKALFVEELQSDWHQAGRQSGYAGPDDPQKQLQEARAKLIQALEDGNEREVAALRSDINDLEEHIADVGRPVPQAPFKKTQEWTELGLKRVLQEAVDGGYDRVVLVRGEQAAELFDLSKQISKLEWDTVDGGETFLLYGDGNQISENRIPAAALSDYVGKDVADRILSASATSSRGALSGQDLKVGGEGMKAFYDKIVPNTLRDFGKAMGFKIEFEPERLLDEVGNLSFRITPEIRQRTSQGMRLYGGFAPPPEAFQMATGPVAAPIIGAAVGAGVSEEDRFKGAMAGAAAGAGVAAVAGGLRTLAKARQELLASGLPESLANYYAYAKRGIDFTGAGERQLAQRLRGGWRDVVTRATDNWADAQRMLDRLAGRAEAKGMPAERSVATALNEALASDATAARAIQHGLGRERGGIIDPVTKEFIGGPLEDVFKPLGGSPVKNEQALTYAVALRNIGRYDKAVADLAEWEARAGRTTLSTRPVSMAMPSGARKATRMRDLIGTAGERVEAAGAQAAKPNPEQVYGGDMARMQADRAIVEAFGQKPEFREFANRMEQYFNNLTEYAVRSGLWTPEQARAIRESDTFYVPFKRLIEAHTGSAVVPMRGMATPGRVGPGVKQFRGSDLVVGNPAVTIAEYTKALIRRSDMYRVGNALIDTVESLGEEAAPLLTKLEAGDPMARAMGVADAESAYRALGLGEEEAKQVADLFTRLDDKNPVIWRNTPTGKEYYLVNDPALWDAVQSINPQDPAALNALITVFGPMKRLATVFATGVNPQFWFGTNIPRDIITAAAQNPGITVSDVGAGIKEAVKSIFGRSAEVEAIGRAGMGQVSQFGGDVNIETMARRLAPTTTSEAVTAAAGRALGAPLRGLERVGRASELPMRLAAARAARRQAATAGATEAGQRAIAARAGAMATVDFRRKAGTAFQRFLERTVPYYGAAKKGGVWFARAAARNPKTVGAAAGAVTLGTVWEYLLSDDRNRQEFVDRPAGERARYLHLGNTRIALPQEFAALAAGVRVGLGQLKQDDPFAFEQFKQAMLNMAPPIYSDILKGDPIALMPFPVGREMIELSRNREEFTGRPIVTPGMERQLPEARRRETTAPTFDVMAKAARGMGLEQASPLQAEYLTRGLFGKFTPGVTAITDIAARPFAGREAQEQVPLPFSRQPLNPVTGFTARPVTRGQSETEFYNLRNEVQQAQATYNALKRDRAEARARGDTVTLNRTTADAERLAAENPVFKAVFEDRGTRRISKLLSVAQEKLDKLQATRDKAVSDFSNGRITGTRARQIIDSLDAERAKLFREGYTRLTQRVPQ